VVVVLRIMLYRCVLKACATDGYSFVTPRLSPGRKVGKDIPDNS